MQQPDGRIEQFPADEALKALEESHRRERETGKAHPVFHIGEELTIKGGKWRVHSFRQNRMVLKAIPY